MGWNRREDRATEPKGCPGQRAFLDNGESNEIANEIKNLLGVEKEHILFGFRKDPPDTAECEVYVWINGSSVEYMYRIGTEWFNWNWTE